MNSHPTPTNCLNCLQVIETCPKSTATPPKVTIEERHLPTGSWECIGYVNGRPITSVCSRNRAYNRREVKSDLAEAGFYPDKELDPVMSAKMPKKSNAKAA